MVENTDFHNPKITNMPSTQATKFFADTKKWLISQERNYFDIMVLLIRRGRRRNSV